VDVIGHEYMRMDGATPADGRFGQAFQIKTAVEVTEEACIAVVSALDDMQRNPGEL